MTDLNLNDDKLKALGFAKDSIRVTLAKMIRKYKRWYDNGDDCISFRDIISKKLALKRKML